MLAMAIRYTESASARSSRCNSSISGAAACFALGDHRRTCDPARTNCRASAVPHEPAPEGFQEFADSEGISAEESSARYLYSKSLGDSITDDAESRARAKGVTKIEKRIVEGHPAHEIVTLAEEAGVEMLFVGSRGVSDLKGLFLGSVSHKVMHLAPCTCVSVK